MGKNLFFFRFTSQLERHQIWDQQPWHFERNILELKEANGVEQSSLVELSKTQFWIRAYDLLLNYRNKEIVSLLTCKGFADEESFCQIICRDVGSYAGQKSDLGIVGGGSGGTRVESVAKSHDSTYDAIDMETLAGANLK